MVPLEHLVQQPPCHVFMVDRQGYHEETRTPQGFHELEREVNGLFGKTLEMERALSFDRESVMGHRGLKKFRGVTKHKRTQRYEAHIWESKKQIYLGGFESELLAARSHDIMALKCKGPLCDALNFEKSDYNDVMGLLPACDKEDIICCLRNYSKTCGQGSTQQYTHLRPHHFKLSVAKGQSLKLKRKHASLQTPNLVNGLTSPIPKGNLCTDTMAPITPQFATGKESLLFDPVQPVDDLCSQGVFLSGEKGSSEPSGQQTPFATYGPLDDTYILDSFSSEASHGMDFGGDVYGQGSDSVNLALTTSVGLHDDDALVPWLE